MFIEIERCSLIRARQIVSLPDRFHFDEDCFHYYSSYFSMEEYSFLLLTNKNIRAWVGIATNTSDAHFFGWPVEIVVVGQELAPEERSRILSEIQKISESKLLWTKSQHYFGKLALKENAQVVNSLNAIIDLSLPEDSILKSVRQSYRSLINKGFRELETTVYLETTDEQTFLNSKNFHIKVSGRQTRSDETWNQQFEMLKNGKAILIEGRLNGLLASSTFVMCAAGVAYYAYGVYDRDLMSKGVSLSHWPVMCAVKESKKKNLSKFVLGHVGPNFSTEKDEKIALFKRGFTDQIEMEVSYKIPG